MVGAGIVGLAVAARNTDYVEAALSSAALGAGREARREDWGEALDERLREVGCGHKGYTRGRARRVS